MAVKQLKRMWFPKTNIQKKQWDKEGYLKVDNPGLTGGAWRTQYEAGCSVAASVVVLYISTPALSH